MTDAEFEILDELYFVISYKDLQAQLSGYPNLDQYLIQLITKGWVKVLEQESDTDVLNFTEFNLNYMKYNYLATKAGLLAHNSSNE